MSWPNESFTGLKPSRSKISSAPSESPISSISAINFLLLDSPVSSSVRASVRSVPRERAWRSAIVIRINATSSVSKVGKSMNEGK